MPTGLPTCGGSAIRLPDLTGKPANTGWLAAHRASHLPKLFDYVAAKKTGSAGDDNGFVL